MEQKKNPMYSEKNLELFPFLDNPVRKPNKNLCDFTDMRTEGLVTLEALKKKNGQTTEETFRTFTDQAKNLVYGIPTGIDDKGNFTFRMIKPRDGRTYDLANQADAMEFHIISKWPRTQKSPFYRKDIELWKVMDLEEESKVFLENERKKDDLRSILLNMSDLDILEIARVLGADVDRNSPTVLRKYVMDLAYNDNNAVKIILQDKKTLDVLKTFKRALSQNIIVQTPHSGYSYGEISLGFNDQEVVSTLLKPEWKERLALIDRNSKESDVSYRKYAGTSKNVDHNRPNIAEDSMIEIEAKDTIDNALLKEIIKRSGAQYLFDDVAIAKSKDDLYKKYASDKLFRDSIRISIEAFVPETQGDGF